MGRPAVKRSGRPQAPGGVSSICSDGHHPGTNRKETPQIPGLSRIIYEMKESRREKKPAIKRKISGVLELSISEQETDKDVEIISAPVMSLNLIVR